MKQYSFYDIKEGDIYEHFAGGLWMVGTLKPDDKKYISSRVNNGIEIQTHNLEDIKQVWFLDQN